MDIYSAIIKRLPVSSQTVSIIDMKIILILNILLITLTSFADYKSTSLGLGLLTEQASKIEETPGGETNSFDATVYAKGQMAFSLYENFDFVFELGLSVPRGSRDSAVTKFNYWGNFLLQNSFQDFSLNYGVGLFYTVLTMDGSPQTLNNGGVEKEFQTPDSMSTSSNLTLNLGLNYAFSEDIYLSLDTSVLNPEDTIERAINYSFSISYEIDKAGKKK